MKSCEAVALDLQGLQEELASFKRCLDGSDFVREQDSILPFFRQNKNLSLLIGTYHVDNALPTHLAFELSFFGDFSCDLASGSEQTGAFCLVEFENAAPDAIFRRSNRSIPEWSNRFEHGFSQVIDWLHAIDDHRNTEGMERVFGTRNPRITALLILGRERDLDKSQRSRLDWRMEHTVVNSTVIKCITFDDLYAHLAIRTQLYTAIPEMD